jgi:hypothetical protein
VSATGSPVAGGGTAARAGWAAGLRFEVVDWTQPDSASAPASIAKTGRKAGIRSHPNAVATNAIAAGAVLMLETLMNRLYAFRGRVPTYYVKNAGFRRLLVALASQRRRG